MITDRTQKNLLWTGGMDSTFLMLRFLDAGDSVQPVYAAIMSTVAETDLAVRRIVLAAIPVSMASRIPAEIIVQPTDIYPLLQQIRLDLIQAGVSIGDRDDQFGYNDVATVAVAQLLGKPVQVVN